MASANYIVLGTTASLTAPSTTYTAVKTPFKTKNQVLQTTFSNVSGTNPTLDVTLFTRMNGAAWVPAITLDQFTQSSGSGIGVRALSLLTQLPDLWEELQVVATVGGSGSPTYTNVAHWLIWTTDY